MNIINVTAELVKELRERTGAGFMACKKALTEENGDIELSIDNLRKSGKVKAEKKTYNITNHGAIFSQMRSDRGLLLELNCETDFVAKDVLFMNFGNQILSEALKQNVTELNELKEIFQERKELLINKTDENIKINHFSYLDGKNIISYVHDRRIGVLVSTDGLDKDMQKGIAMHIAASKPGYLHPKDISDSIVAREYQIQLELSKKFQKSDNILKKIVEGRMKKFINSITLIGQDFIIDPSITVGQLLEKNNAKILSFIRYEIGNSIIRSNNVL